jgi:hypothetical protein
MTSGPRQERHFFVSLPGSLLLLLSGLFDASPAVADCIDYEDYLHWKGRSNVSCDEWSTMAALVTTESHAYLIEDRIPWTSLNFYALDIRDPARPVVSGQLQVPIGFSAGIALDGEHVYIAGLYGLAVIDVSTPSSPVIVGGLEGGFAGAVVVSGSYAFVAGAVGTAWGFISLDITDPTTPRVAGVAEIPRGFADIAVSNGYAFVACNYTDSLAVIDVSVPETPHMIGALVMARPYRVAAEGPWVYVGHEGTRPGLTVIDASNPAQLRPMGELEGYIEDLVAGPGLVYIARPSGLGLVDTSDPESPQLVKNLLTMWPARAVSLSGEQVGVASNPGPPVPMDNGVPQSRGEIKEAPGGGCTFFELADIAPPDSPPVLGSLLVPASIRDIEVDGDVAHIVHGNFSTVDISDPSLPQILGGVNAPGNRVGLAIEGDFAYVAAYESGLQVIDISHLSAPQIVATVDTPGLATGVALHGPYAYVADGAAGVQIITIADPRAPQIAGNLATSGYAGDIVIVGELAYVAAWCPGLHVLDISTPLDPQILGTAPIVGCASGVAVEWPLAAVASTSGVELVDIADPRSPFALGSLATSGVERVAIRDRYVYAGDLSGLLVIDAGVPTHPRLMGLAGGSARSVTVAENQVYVGVSWPITSFDILPAQCPRIDPVLISRFEARIGDGGVELEWTTAFQDQVAGFNVGRSPLAEDRFVQLNGSLIATDPRRSDYSFVDSTSTPGRAYRYRLEVVDLGGRVTTEAVLELDVAPTAAALRLRSIHPNPSPGDIVVQFDVPSPAMTELAIYDPAGRLARRLLHEPLRAGSHARSWDLRDDHGTRIPAGVYLLRLVAGDRAEVRKIVVVR